MFPGGKMDQEKYNRLRERSDRISALMGEYMLKGYRMLGTCCPECGTVLLKFRDQPDYCVACKEIDSKETTSSSEEVNQSETVPTLQPEKKPVAASADFITAEMKKPSEQTAQTEHHKVGSSTCESMSTVSLDAINIAIHHVNDKIVWASEALKDSKSTQEAIQVCELLQKCAETLKRLREVQT